MKKLTDENKRDLLQEMISSPGWSVFCNDVFSEVLKNYSTVVFTSARNGDDVANPIGKYDGAIDLMQAVYEAAGCDLPKFFSNLRRNGA